MKKFGIFILVIIALLGLLVLSAGFILPHIISVDDYRGKVQEKFASATGYQIDFDDVELAIYPMVHANAKNVEIKNGNETLAKIEGINAFADPWKLIKGEVEISSVELKSPKIYFEKTAAGNNWQKESAIDNASESSQSSKKQSNFSIAEITIMDGALNYDDATTQSFYKVEKLNLSSAITSPDSPISAIGDLEFSGERFAVEAAIPNFDAEKFEVSLQGLGSNLKFTGDPKSGDFELKSEDINKLAKLVSGNDSVSVPNPKISASGSFVLNDETSILDLKSLEIGGSKGSGKIAIAANSKITANLDMDRIVVEDFIAENSSSSAVQSSSGGGNAKKGLVPEDLALRISLKSKDFKYKDLNLGDFNLQADINKGEVVMQPLSFAFENGGNFEAYGVYNQPSPDKQAYEGKISASGNDLYNILRGYEIDTSSYKSSQLKKFAIDTNLFVNISNNINIDMASLKANLGETRFSGSAQYKTGNRDEITLRGGVNILNLDNLLADKIAPTAQVDIRNQAKDKSRLSFDWLKNMRAKMNIALAVEKIILNGESYNKLRAVAISQNKEMDIQNLSVTAMGTQLSGNMKISAAGKRPFINTNLNLGYLDFPNEIKTARSASSNSAVSRWSSDAISLSPLDEFDSNFSIKIQGVKKGDLQFSNIGFRGNLANSVLNISDLSTRAFGGNVSAVGTIGVGLVPSFNIKLAGENLDAPTFSRQLMNNNKIVSGALNIGGTFASSGGNEAGLVQNLKGGFAIGGTNIVLNGFDLENFVRKITNINSPVEVGLLATKVLNGGGQTLLTSVKGNFGIEKGIANSSGVDLQTRVGLGIFSGAIDLPKWQMDTNADFKIDLGDQKERPKVGVRMYGGIESFKKSYDYSEVISYYSKRFGVSDKLGNIIDGFLSPKK